MEPTLERTGALSAARAHLNRGFRFEQAGSLARALEEYRDAIDSKPIPAEEIDARHAEVPRDREVVLYCT